MIDLKKVAIATQDESSLYFDARYEERISAITAKNKAFVVAKVLTDGSVRFYDNRSYDIIGEEPWQANIYKKISNARSNRTWLRKRCRDGNISGLDKTEDDKINVYEFVINDYDIIPID